MPQAAIALVFVAFVAAGVASGRARPGGQAGSAAATAAVVRDVAPIARDVEAIRGLRFKHLPRPVVVTPAQTRRSALEELDREAPAARRRAAAEVLELLGLVPPGTDLRAIADRLAPDTPERTAVLRARPGKAVGLRHRARVTDATDGWDRLEVGFGRLDAMVSEVLGYGEDLVVEGPDDLRDGVVARLEEVLAATAAAPAGGHSR
jgi:hypothetical protein